MYYIFQFVIIIWVFFPETNLSKVITECEDTAFNYGNNGCIIIEQNKGVVFTITTKIIYEEWKKEK
jgi:hypothetical protein